MSVGGGRCPARAGFYLNGVMVGMMKTIRSALLQCVLALSALGALAPLNGAHAQALPSHQTGQEVDRIVAVVNNDVITRRELDLRMALITRRLQQQNAPLPSPDQLQLQVLNQIVLERIQLQRAKDDGIVIDDATLQRTLTRLAQANNMSLDMYRARLEAEGVPWSVFSADARNELLLSKLREKEVDSRITVSDAEVANYIASQRGPTQRVHQDLRFEHILIKAALNAPQTEIEAARQKASDLLKRALANEDFARLAKDNSQAPDASNGGDLGFRSMSALPEAMTQAASQLRPGQVNPEVLRTPEGFEIVRLVDRRVSSGTGSEAPKLVQTHARHILIRIGEGQSEPAARQKLVELRAQIEAGGDFANFARTYSQDGSASQGGDLGWISPGETVPEFERAMNNLKDGEISQPIRTEYGYHLVQVIGRREAQGSVAQQQEIARQAIGQRKAEQAYADWLRQLRDSSYVQYKLDGPA
ncbi:periplasmic chaperone for outer membrane proteins SurA [Burkholderia sp. b14]|nr:periplasmic chaperone for outer membrane proteins SurA [Burkholderia sp. b13]SIT73001.1 periplasmic chaperone for outer membrane proteins SurA [Burkholderia sp. b14]